MPFSENETGSLVYMTSSVLTVTHAFTTRYGGVSGGIHSSLNLGQNVGDNPGDVRQNYGILGAALGVDPERLVFSQQVHKTDVRTVTGADARAPYSPVPYEADGLITSEENVPLMIFTADCVPILLFDPVGCAIGAVHAGWRGTTRDIAGNAVREMALHFGSKPENIRAAVGPSISACCYETGRDVADAVHRLLGCDTQNFAVPRRSVSDTNVSSATVTDGGKYIIDLKGLNGYLLRRAGLTEENIDISPECTSCRSDKYWSHRKTHGRRGSQASVIMLKGNTN